MWGKTIIICSMCKRVFHSHQTAAQLGTRVRVKCCAAPTGEVAPDHVQAAYLVGGFNSLIEGPSHKLKEGL